MNPGLNYENAPNIIGGGYGSGWGNGFGGFGAFGLLGLLGIGDLNRRRGGDDGVDCCEDIKNNARNLAVLEAIANNKDATIAEGRALGSAICETNSNLKDAQFALAIQANANTDQLKVQAQAFQVANDAKFDALSRQISDDGQLTRTLITNNEIQNLRDQLLLERRRGDSKDIEISINNSNAQAQAQVQAQFQAQNDWLKNRFFEFDNQINNTKQGIVNLGTMVASGTQSTAATNIGK